MDKGEGSQKRPKMGGRPLYKPPYVVDTFFRRVFERDFQRTEDVDSADRIMQEDTLFCSDPYLRDSKVCLTDSVYICTDLLMADLN